MMVLQLAISLLAGMGFAKLIEMFEAWSRDKKTIKKLDEINDKIRDIKIELEILNTKK